ENYTVKHISAIVGISTSTVQNIISRISKSGTPLPGKVTGAPKKRSERDDGRLQSLVRKEPFSSYDKIN
ncbi:hypothetical protein BCV71DRAFT_162973, partial [Rhizopus microsporus]